MCRIVNSPRDGPHCVMRLTRSEIARAPRTPPPADTNSRMQLAPAERLNLLPAISFSVPGASRNAYRQEDLRPLHRGLPTREVRLPDLRLHLGLELLPRTPGAPQLLQARPHPGAQAGEERRPQGGGLDHVRPLDGRL